MLNYNVDRYWTFNTELEPQGLDRGEFRRKQEMPKLQEDFK